MSELLVLPKCRVTPTGLTLDENLTFDEWADIGDGLQRVHGSIQWLIGDWLNYGEKKFGELAAQSIGPKGLDYQTLANYKWVAKEIDESRRNKLLSWTIHREIASSPREQQEELLEKATSENLKSREIRQLVREFKKTPTPTLPDGKYEVIYADPPWDVQAGPVWGSSGESRDLIYPTMSIDEIKVLPVGTLAGDNCHLYLWTINKYIPETYDIARGWGFEPSCLLTWTKPPHGIGLGGTFVQTTEHLLFCRKGNLEAQKRIDTTWFHYPRGRHSEKPQEFRDMIEEVSPGRKIELFARTKSEGWDVWGNEV